MSHEMLKKEALFDCADSVESFKCFDCADFETDNLVHLKHHVKAGHTLRDLVEGLYKCGRCNFQTYSIFISARHQLVNLCRRDVQIKSEATILEKTRKLQNRQKNQSNPGESIKDQWYECEHCPYGTKVIRSLKRHVLVKHTDPDEVQWFKCEQCSHKCRTNCSLKKHMNYKHYNVSYLCDRCPFETKSKPTLNHHILSKHTEPDQIRWFNCEQCSYKCKLKFNLKTHVHFKHGDKTCLRCEHCSFETKSKYMLKKHVIWQHTELQWFGCKYCPYKSKIKGNLKNHMVRTHGNKYLNCEHCSFETRYKPSLRKHVLKKHAEKAAGAKAKLK